MYICIPIYIYIDPNDNKQQAHGLIIIAPPPPLSS